MMGGIDWDLISSYGGILTLATLSVFCGAFGSLPRLSSKNDDEDEEDATIIDSLSAKEAWLFPVAGSIALCSLYFIIKYLGTEWINWLMGWYFSFAGVLSVWQSLVALARFTVGERKWKSYKEYHLFDSGSKELKPLSLRTPALCLLPLAALPSILYSISKSGRRSVLLTNILSLSFAQNALSIVKLDSFKTGTILLSGLFFYDIWWVFGTEVMVSVATNLDVPIKLLWPKSVSLAQTRGFTMLGLGDIVIPGTFIALSLRYDQHRFVRSPSRRPFAKPYFWTSLVSYVLGLFTTMFVMHVFGHAQPALLYLSPACILSFLLTAVMRGELKDAWAWNESPEKSDSATKSANPKNYTATGDDVQVNGEAEDAAEGNLKKRNGKRQTN